MSNIKAIRERLGLTQTALAAGMGCTQGNVGHYEKGQTVPPDAAKRLIDFAHSLGHVITFNDIYMPELAAAPATIAQAAIEVVAPPAAALSDTDHIAQERRERERRDVERRASAGVVVPNWNGIERRDPNAPPYLYPDIDRRGRNSAAVDVDGQGV